MPKKPEAPIAPRYRLRIKQRLAIVEYAVARGQARKERRLPRRIGVDEKALTKGHRYLTLVCDLETPTIEYVAEDRKQASLEGYFAQFPEAARAVFNYRRTEEMRWDDS